MTPTSLELDIPAPDPGNIRFCEKFIHSTSQPKYLFGRNIYAKKILQHIDIAGVIDDYTEDAEYLEKPIVKMADVPADALVLILSGGRPMTADQRVKNLGFECLDYFAFYKYSGLPLENILFLDGFAEDFSNHRKKYDWVYGKLSDDLSREQFLKLLNFKVSYDLNCLRGFQHLEDKQYFEDFLALEPAGEVFADVGSFDGYTTAEFIKLCPGFEGVHIFEPIPENMVAVKARLASYHNIHYHQMGLSDKRQILRFAAGGSISRITEDGAEEAEVAPMDELIDSKITFIKMDIEGGELNAIEGARETIAKYTPRLAVSVYHRPSDIWQIPQKILSINSNYALYLRHYTESVYETVMFFIPTRNSLRPDP